MKRVAADFLLLFVTFAWGATFVLVQHAIRFIPVFSFLFIRFAIAGLIMFLPVLLHPRLRFALTQKALWLSGFWLGVWLFAGYALQTLGLLYTTPAKSGFITGLCVVLVPVFSVLILRKNPSKGAWYGVAVAACGLFLLSYSPTDGVNIGDVLSFFCAISFAVQIVAMGRYAPRFSPLPLAAVQILTVGLLSLLTVALTGARLFTTSQTLMQPMVVEALAVCIVFATILAYFTQTAFQKYTTPTKTALIFAMEPVFAALTAYLWAHEQLNVFGFIGCALILIGMLIAEFGGRGADGMPHAINEPV